MVAWETTGSRDTVDWRLLVNSCRQRFVKARLVLALTPSARSTFGASASSPAPALAIASSSSLHLPSSIFHHFLPPENSSVLSCRVYPPHSNTTAIFTAFARNPLQLLLTQ